MSSDEAEKKNVEEPSKEAISSAEETEENEDEKPKEEKVNNKAAAKKKGADPPKIKQPAKKRVKSEQAEKETKKEEKKEVKKKVEEKEEDEEEEDEESGEENDVNHKTVPLLDQPLEISGKRQSREVQRFKPVEPEEENKEVKIPEGSGKALGEIERIEFNIQRAKPEDLKLLHRLCFGKPGKAATVKKVLKKFKGFEFAVDSADFKKKKEFVDKSFKKVTVAHLKNVCNILDIERSGTKEDHIERILKFITCPVDSGKKLPGGGRSKRKAASNKNYEEDEESHKSKKKSKAKKKDAESDDSENEKEDDEEEEDEKEDADEKEEEKKKEDIIAEESEEEKSEVEEEVKPKKGAKRGKKAAEAADKKAPPKKRAAAKKAAEKAADSEADADADESEDEEPLSKKAKAPPTDEELKTYVKSLLEGANLELITMKKVCQDVYAHYPDFDLAHKKDFIKTTVKNLISS